MPVDSSDQALVDERAESFEHVIAIHVLGPGGHLLDRLHRDSGEHREQPEQPLLPGVQHLVAPVDGVPQGLLASRGVTRSAAKQLQSAPEALDQCLSRKETQPGGRQLDREGKPVQPDAQLGDGRRVGFGELEVGINRPGPIHEQLDGVGLGVCASGSSRSFGSGTAIGGTGRTFSPRTRRASRLVTSCFRPGASRRGAVDRRGGRHDLLEVVEHEQHRRSPMCSWRSSISDRPGLSSMTDRLGDGREHGVGVVARRQVDEETRSPNSVVGHRRRRGPAWSSPSRPARRG